jgi:hypothetical protein
MAAVPAVLVAQPIASFGFTQSGPEPLTAINDSLGSLDEVGPSSDNDLSLGGFTERR